ncbi:MAG: beta-ketoacyl-[acyl-carrier-protein] synthase family protein [Paludibacteraceae bacterium]|nr:beta-ketoacyl-[acyl-carrier-protein] synthase family protein [Paludibacteraceae bacterium]
MNRVFVTGIGAISAIGNNVAEQLQALQQGTSNIAPAKLLKSTLKLPVAEIPFSNKELTSLAELPTEETFSRTFLLGLIAAKEALKTANLTDRSDLQFISSSTNAAIEITENIYKNPEEHLPLLRYFHANQIPLDIAKELGICGRQYTISTACSSSANGIMLATRLIRSGKAKRVLVGGNDSLSRFSINGFNALEIASVNGCRPFDKNRDGVSLGEAGAYLVLESEEAAKGKHVYGEIKGFANVNEAYHATSTSPDGKGAKQAINDALAVANLTVSDISYINAHGTGTKINDLSESIAISELFGSQTPISSTKGCTGHTLAACGALEAVFSLLAIQEQQVWGNGRLLEPLTETNMNIVRETHSATVNHVLSNSFGFGGNDTSLIFSKI